MTEKDLKDLGYIENYPKFEALIKTIVKENISDANKKTELYEALCNIIWYEPDELLMYSCSWRYAGGLISECEQDGIGNYLEYYCSGNEGLAVDWIINRLAVDNWYPAEYGDDHGI